MSAREREGLGPAELARALAEGAALGGAGETPLSPEAARAEAESLAAFAPRLVERLDSLEPEPERAAELAERTLALFADLPSPAARRGWRLLLGSPLLRVAAASLLLHLLALPVLAFLAYAPKEGRLGWTLSLEPPPSWPFAEPAPWEAERAEDEPEAAADRDSGEQLAELPWERQEAWRSVRFELTELIRVARLLPELPELPGLDRGGVPVGPAARVIERVTALRAGAAEQTPVLGTWAPSEQDSPLERLIAAEHFLDGWIAGRSAELPPEESLPGALRAEPAALAALDGDLAPLAGALGRRMARVDAAAGLGQAEPLVQPGRSHLARWLLELEKPLGSEGAALAIWLEWARSLAR